jgi:predicted transcriptional regulator of viral defense system
MFAPTRVLHRNEILADGIDGPGITELVALGVLTRLWRGFYTTGETVGLPDPRGVTRSMRVALGHESAAAWCGVDLAKPVDRLHVVAPRNRGRRSDDAPGVRIHRADLEASDVRVVRGVRVTAPNRTISDIARAAPLAEAVAAADGFLRRRLTTVSSLQSYVEQLAGPRRPAALRVAALADPLSASVFESLTRVLLIESGIRPPTPQLTILSEAKGWIGRVDFAWPDARLVLECDGFEHHSSLDAFNRDRRRWSALTRAGWRVAVVTWHDVVSDPSYVVGLVSDLLAAA